MSLQLRLQTASTDFQSLQAEHSSFVESKQRLEAQLSENEMVKKEFDQLPANNIIYKQIGPVLVKQDPAEARSNVQTRLGFIRSEVKRVEGQIKEIEERMEKKKGEIVELQQQTQPAIASP